MDYDELVAKIIELLQREKRVPYRSLKRRFDVDDEYIEDLKIDLIEAKRFAIDENDRILVWVGDAQTVTSQVAQATQPLAAQEQPSPLVEPRPTAPPPPDAERRQLSLLFCDLVDSTKLSSQLDPEEYRDVVRAYQRVCSEVITRFDGHIAQLLGDGLLVYFGYPQAHEDDAQRAVRTGLGILDAMDDLNTRLKRKKGIQLAVRVGIHTGLVVVGAMGGGARHEQLALGETPNIAARIQGLTAPNTLVVSSVTYRLIQGYFEWQDLGAQTLRGVSEPVHVYQVLSESGAHSRLDIASARGLTPLVGRESEVTLLQERWQQAKSGQGQVILLSGDPGIGKSRLVQILKEHVANESHTRWECRSTEYYQNSALYPVIDLFQRILQLEAQETPDAKLEKLEQMLSQYRLPVEDTVPLFAPLLSLALPEHRYPPLNLSSQRQRQKTLETLVAILQELAEHQPVLFIVEDLHWTDPSTLELLNLVLDQTPTVSLLVLLTCRPYFQPAWHHRSYLTEITVNRLSHTQVEQIVNRTTDGETLPTEVLQQIIAKTDGVPLFIEELTKATLESGQLKAVDGHYELIGSFSAFAIPATLQDSLMARLDRLVTAKAVAQYAAVIGRQFSYELLQAVSQLDEVMLQHELRRLVEAELMYQRGVPPQSTYMFKHALIQDAAYESLLKSTRQHYHQRIAQVLEARFPETTETQPELLAHHCTDAGLNEQAVSYWHKAGQRASERSAHVEAISHLTKGLELLHALPDTPERPQQEVEMQIILGLAVLTTKGNATPEVEKIYTRAWQLCQQLGETSQLFPVLQGLWSYYLVQAEYQRANDLIEQSLHMAQGPLHAIHLMQVHSALGTVFFWGGELRRAQAHLEQAVALDDSQLHQALPSRTLRLSCRFATAWVLWALGYPERALQSSDGAFTLAKELSRPFSLAFALNQSARLYQFRQDGQCTRERAEASIRLSTEQGFPQPLAGATFLRGWALTQQGQYAQGIAEMHQGLAAYRTTGAEHQLTYFLALLAEGYGRGGQREEGLTILAEALALVDKKSERFYEAELHRLQGELLLQQNSANQAEAETCFQHAIAIAQNQQAKSWELRASTSLARLWQRQGKRQEAYDLLAPVYGWFTEGFDTADLKDAKALIDELEERR
jgi:predicted ATPase/class 3 adenylate cyclase